jgi:hypothetical protein
MIRQLDFVVRLLVFERGLLHASARELRPIRFTKQYLRPT